MERIDTHQTVKDLIAAGLPEKQAEAVTTAINNTSNLATKEDIKDLKRDIKYLEEKFEIKLNHLEEKVEIKFKHLEEKMATKTELKETAHEIIKWVVGSSIATVSISVTIVIAFLSYYR